MRVFVEAHGASQNPGEAEGLARATAEAGHSLSPVPREADVAVRLTCAVIGGTEERSRDLTLYRLLRAPQRMERWVGRRADALVVEGGPGETGVARLDSYLPVIRRPGPALGSVVPVRIYGVRSTCLLGELAGPAPGRASAQRRAGQGRRWIPGTGVGRANRL